MTKIEKILAKLQEPSTIKGMIMVAALFGVCLSPELQEKIVAGSAALYALVQIFVSND